MVRRRLQTRTGLILKQWLILKWLIGSILANPYQTRSWQGNSVTAIAHPQTTTDCQTGGKQYENTNPPGVSTLFLTLSTARIARTPMRTKPVMIPESPTGRRRETRLWHLEDNQRDPFVAYSV
ncbi:hypothetical protein BGZ57DRAFT_337379 [Hyaloscypha finlandica]|nr:hypothetical protein BGZ57DRAFT_337379 [Hyaloscypha finlandica]